MAFYGYTPKVKDYSGIGIAAGQIGQGITGAAEAAELEKTQQAAIDLVNKDFSLLDKAYKAYVTAFKEDATKAGWTPEQIGTAVQKIVVPTRTEYAKSPAGTFKRLGDAFMSLKEQTQQQARQQQLGSAVREAKQPGFAPSVGTGAPQQVDVPQVGGQPEEGYTEEDVIERERVPGAVGQEEIAERIPSQLGATSKELKEVPEFAGAPTTQQQQAQQPKPMTAWQQYKKEKDQTAQKDPSGATWNQRQNIKLKEYGLKLRERALNENEIRNLNKDRKTYEIEIQDLQEELKSLKSPPKELDPLTSQMVTPQKDFEAVQDKVDEIAGVNNRIKYIDNELFKRHTEQLNIGKRGGGGGGGKTQIGGGGESPEKTKLYQFQAELQNRLKTQNFEGTTEQEINQMLQQIQDRINAITG